MAAALSISSWADAARNAVIRSLARRAVRELSDWQLRDIGLTRADLDAMRPRRLHSEA